MVTACTNSVTTKVTALLEHLYGKVIINKWCGTEFCQDTPDYLRSLKSESYLKSLSTIQSKSRSTRELFIVALDVEGLYPNSPRLFVYEGLERALNSQWSKETYLK